MNNNVVGGRNCSLSDMLTDEKEIVPKITRWDTELNANAELGLGGEGGKAV